MTAAAPDHAAKLRRMACQIAQSFQALPPDQRPAAIAGHINQFWAPPMRRALADTPSGTLPPEVRAALKLTRLPEKAA